MLKIDANNNVYLTRGDSAYLELNIRSSNGPYIFQDGDVIALTIKKSVHDENVILQKLARDGELKIEPSDTKLLDYGEYVYDIQITTSDGDVFTVISPAKFVLKDEVTW